MGAPGSDTNEPDFMIIGAMKAGTTSLWHYLQAHPQIQMARNKEVRFFSFPEFWERGWDWYIAQFPVRAAATVAMGEASVSYSKSPQFPDVPERIAAHLPRSRFIYLVRNPIERMRSHFLHEVRRGREGRPIDEALLDDPRYLDASRYAMQIERYLASFQEDQFLVMTSEHLRDHRAEAIARTLRFLSADPDWRGHAERGEFNRSEDLKGLRPSAARLRKKPALRRLARFAPDSLRRSIYHPVTPEVPDVSPETRSVIADRLAPDIRRLRGFIQEPFEGWGIA